MSSCGLSHRLHRAGAAIDFGKAGLRSLAVVAGQNQVGGQFSSSGVRSFIYDP